MISSLTIQSLKCEYQSRLLGSDVATPRFSWMLETANRRGVVQVAYQLQLKKQEDDYSASVWDTGRVQSDQSLHCVYEGPALESLQSYRFRVRHGIMQAMNLLGATKGRSSLDCGFRIGKQTGLRRKHQPFRLIRKLRFYFVKALTSIPISSMDGSM
jgi:hypothetical protein